MAGRSSGRRVAMLVGVWAIFLCWTEIDAAAFMSLGPCPEGIAKNETWYPDVMPGSSNNAKVDCMSCTCLEQPDVGYECRNCGVYSIGLSSPECYVTKSTPHLHYPKCCDVEERCPGHPDYDASKVESGVVG